MLDNAGKTCGFEHEIVSYMYGELGASDRAQFETHIAECDSCTDEFAAVSLSRFSVFEWQKEEFAHLSTPTIVIPYKAKEIVAEKAGWLAGFAEIFAFARSPLAVGAAFAILLGIGFFGFNLIGTGGSEIASNNVVPPVAVEQKVELPELVNLPVATLVENTEEPGDIRSVKAASPEIRTRAVRRSSPSRRVVENRSVPNPTREARRAPVLSDLGDDDEDSLRLSDMFNEIGG